MDRKHTENRKRTTITYVPSRIEGTNKMSVIWFPLETLRGTYLFSVVFLSVFCLSVLNANISKTIIARAAKFGMLILHIKSAKFVEGIFKRCLCS